LAAPQFGSPGRGIAIGFAAGAVSALTFHAFAWWIFYRLGLQGIPPYPMRPNMIGVPIIASLAFWAGVWGIVMVLVAPRVAPPFWAVCLVVSVAASLVQIFVVPPLRGGAINWDMLAWLRALVINGVWGIGVAIIASALASRRAALDRLRRQHRLAVCAAAAHHGGVAQGGSFMRMMAMLTGLLVLAGCAPASSPGVAGPPADLEFQCSAESMMAAGQGSNRTDARLRALDTRRECFDAARPPPAGGGRM